MEELTLADLFGSGPAPLPTGATPPTTKPAATAEKHEAPNSPVEALFNPGAPIPQTKEPNAPQGEKDAPKAIVETKEQPKDPDIIMIGKTKKKIKPTKLRYFRNRVASIYDILVTVPLQEFLSYDAGVFDPERDSDQILFDFLVAVFDDEKFVREHYDDITADEVEQLIQIFGRLNHIEEKKEKARKNREAQAAAAKKS